MLCSHALSGSRSSAKTTTLSPLEDQYDISYVKIDIAMSNTSTYVSGSSKTTAKVLSAAPMTQYAFELDSLITIDSVLVNGLAQSNITRSGALVTVSLATGIAAPGSFTAQVFYHGTPPASAGINIVNGVLHNVLSSGTQITFTISDMYAAKDWWGSKQSLTDKIDSADVWVTVPAGLKVGSNGVLNNVTPMPGGDNRYEWKTRYPIDYYLLSVAVAPYAERTDVVHFPGSTDTMPVLSYLYDSAVQMPIYAPILDSMPMIIEHFSTLYGRYPFWQEKYGHCLAPVGGGMEHQTMTTIGPINIGLDLSTFAHEMGHQWWGDCVTYSSWADIWMSEGFATYTEHLFHEHFYGAANAKSWRTSVFNYVMGSPGGTVYVDDTTDALRVFDGRLTYRKGASVAHMLRYEINNDSLYFLSLRNYLQQHAFSLGNTEDFKNSVEATSGLELDTFFNQWIYGEGYPKYTGKWNQVGGTVFIQLTQTTSKPTVTPLFVTPIDIQLHAATGDTLIRVRSDAATQTFVFDWGSQLTGFSLDPNEQILNKVLTITQDATLGVAAPWAKEATIAPNPARDSWTLSNLPAHTALMLTDAGGRLCYSGTYESGAVAIPAQSLAPGVYYLRMTPVQGGAVVRKVVRR